MGSSAQRVFDQITKLLEELEAIFVDDPTPVPNPRVLEAVRASCLRIKELASDGYISEKCDFIVSRATDYFSVRKHEKHPGGASALMRQMRYEASRCIGDQAQWILRASKGETNPPASLQVKW